MAKFKFFSNLKVDGNCNKCKYRIEGRLMQENGIYEVAWDLSSKMLSLHYEYEVISLAKIKEIITLLGHDVDELKAPEGAYYSLPPSCRYREPRDE